MNAQAVVAHVERLALALDPVAEDGDRLVPEDLLDAVGRVVGALDALLDRVADADLFHDCPRGMGRGRGVDYVRRFSFTSSILT